LGQTNGLKNINIKNLKILAVNIYCAFMLWSVLLFTDIIKCVDAVGVIPELICVHVHAVLTTIMSAL
jgi:hypothetical protein